MFRAIMVASGSTSIHFIKFSITTQGTSIGLEQLEMDQGDWSFIDQIAMQPQRVTT